MTNENAKPLDGITRFEPTIVEDGDGDPVGEMVEAYLGDWIKFSDARQSLSESVSTEAAWMEKVAVARNERDALAQAIFEAATKAGIYNGEGLLTGPALILLCQNLGEPRETPYAGSLQRAASALRKASGELIYGVAKALDISHFACRAERDAVLTALHEIDAVLAKNPVNAEPSASTQSAGTMESALNPGPHSEALRDAARRNLDLRYKLASVDHDAVTYAAVLHDVAMSDADLERVLSQTRTEIGRLEAAFEPLTSSSKGRAEWPSVVGCAQEGHAVGTVPDGQISIEETRRILRSEPPIHVGYIDPIGPMVPAIVSERLAAAKKPPSPVTDEMVSRFLSWKLPEDFAPDCHISFKLPDPVLNPNPSWPVGTNLLTAIQARAMLEHVLAAQTILSQGTIRDRIEALLLHDLEEACTPSECALLADRLAAALVNPQEPTR